MNLFTDNQIKKMSYPDFIGAMGLENTSLLGDFAVDYWISNASINKTSKILEIACSTGFNLRQCAIKVLSSGIGIDTSEPSIQCALEKSRQEQLNNNLHFQVENATKLPFSKNSFTHVIAGMSFAFIQHREKALKEASRVLCPQGYLLTAILYYKEKPTIQLLDEIEKVFSFRPCNSWNYNWWKTFFSKLFTLKNEVSVINTKTVTKSESTLKEEIFQYVFNNNHKLKKYEKKIKVACAERLFNIHQTIRKHSQYQTGKIQVWSLR